MVTYSDIQGGYAGEGNIDADPLFVAPDDGDYHLSAGSPCIDAGSIISDSGGVDFWGNRITDHKPDIGAHEWRAEIGR